jgi:hypothetical protein
MDTAYFQSGVCNIYTVVYVISNIWHHITVDCYDDSGGFDANVCEIHIHHNTVSNILDVCVGKGDYYSTILCKLQRNDDV